MDPTFPKERLRCVDGYMCVCIYVCVCVYICVCICVYVCTYVSICVYVCYDTFMCILYVIKGVIEVTYRSKIILFANFLNGRWICDNTSCTVFLTQSHLRDRLPEPGGANMYVCIVLYSVAHSIVV